MPETNYTLKLSRNEINNMMTALLLLRDELEERLKPYIQAGQLPEKAAPGTVKQLDSVLSLINRIG